MATMTDADVIQCPHCGAKNRVSADRLARGAAAAICGRCRTPLPVDGARDGASSRAADGTVRVVTDATFAEQVERSPLPVLLDLWAPWCGPCRMLAPAIEQIAREYAGKARVAKLNIDENPATANRFRVASIPTLLVFQNGREVDRIVGLQPAPAIAQRLARFVG